MRPERLNLPGRLARAFVESRLTIVLVLFTLLFGFIGLTFTPREENPQIIVPAVEVTVAGGRLRNDDIDVLGPGMEALFTAYKVDIGIYGVAGVDEDGTLLDFYEEEVRARQIIRENSRASFLVLDSTKFGRTAHVRGGQIGEATKVFCERKPPEEIISRLKQSGAELVICGGGGSA